MCDVVPYARYVELYPQLELDSQTGTLRRARDSKSEQKGWLPGYPTTNLLSPSIGNLLFSELCTPHLDGLSPHLWLVATQDSSHISSLTQQIVRGRRIVVTQDPELHLVWIQDRVFVKPLPKVLLSYVFWEYYLVSSRSPITQQAERLAITRAAKGFLRSYCFLIRHKYDLILAQSESHPLLPRGLRFSSLMHLLAHVQESVSDEDVSPRFHYGELRLSRLNFWTKVFSHRTRHAKVHWQYGAYLAQHYAPILVIFGFLSVILSAMQVGLGVAPLSGPDSAFVRGFSQASKIFTVIALLLVCICMAYLFLLWFSAIAREVVFAVGVRWSHKSARRR